MAGTQPVRIDVSARTPQAADDVANAGEDAVGLISIAQLISNDAGGDGKRFFGVGPDHGVAASTAKTTQGAAVSVVGFATECWPGCAGAFWPTCRPSTYGRPG